MNEIDKLPIEIRTRFWQAARAQGRHKIIEQNLTLGASLHSALNNFIWIDTKEGHTYWEKVYRNACNGVYNTVPFYQKYLKL